MGRALAQQRWCRRLVSSLHGKPSVLAGVLGAKSRPTILVFCFAFGRSCSTLTACEGVQQTKLRGRGAVAFSVHHAASLKELSTASDHDVGQRNRRESVILDLGHSMFCLLAQLALVNQGTSWGIDGVSIRGDCVGAGRESIPWRRNGPTVDHWNWRLGSKCN